MLDIGVVVLVALFAISGYKKGLIISFVNVVGTIVACAAASFLSSVLSTAIYTNLIEQHIVNSVEQAAQEIPVNADAIEKAGEILTNLPNSIYNMLSFLGVHTENLAAEIDTTNLGIPQLVESMVSPHAVRLISTILTVILFIILSIALKYAAHLLTKALEAVKLGNINKLLGSVFGIVESAFIIMVITLLVYFVMMFLSPETCSYVNDRIGETVIYKVIYQYSMPDAIMKMILPK